MWGAHLCPGFGLWQAESCPAGQRGPCTASIPDPGASAPAPEQHVFRPDMRTLIGIFSCSEGGPCCGLWRPFWCPEVLALLPHHETAPGNTAIRRHPTRIHPHSCKCPVWRPAGGEQTGWRDWCKAGKACAHPRRREGCWQRLPCSRGILPRAPDGAGAPSFHPLSAVLASCLLDVTHRQCPGSCWH